jgi:phosphoenolpyruvate carboxykinase (GTP)
MAMLAFCGYNIGDYFGHWLRMGRSVKNPPRIFRVNWFRTDEHGKFLWPGYGENLRVIKWIFDRCDGVGKGTSTPIGIVPTINAIDRTGNNISDEAMEALLKVDPADWSEAAVDQAAFLDSVGPRLPREMREEQQRLAKAVVDPNIGVR